MGKYREFKGLHMPTIEQEFLAKWKEDCCFEVKRIRISVCRIPNVNGKDALPDRSGGSGWSRTWP